MAKLKVFSKCILSRSNRVINLNTTRKSVSKLTDSTFNDVVSNLNLIRLRNKYHEVCVYIILRMTVVDLSYGSSEDLLNGFCRNEFSKTEILKVILYELM